MNLVFVVGPTASGKSGLALSVAKMCGAVIFNTDSLQVYRDLNIGTAKPTEAEMQLAPHRMFSFLDIGQTLTAGEYRKKALEELRQLELQGAKSVLAVGGSGFYINALENGMYELGAVSEETKQAVLTQAQSQEGRKELYHELQGFDLEYAEKINPMDSYRIVRAVEIIREFGEKPSKLREKFAPEKLPYPVKKIGLRLEREKLRSKIEIRTKSMLEQGFVSEVQNIMSLLKSQGLTDWAPLRSVGYREVVDYLSGKLPEAELCEAIVQSTMKLAKKQMTWFKRDKEIHWFDAETELNSAKTTLLDMCTSVSS